MKSIVARSSQADGLDYIDSPTPLLKNGQVLVQIEAIGVGLNDFLRRRYVFSEQWRKTAGAVDSITLGHDVAGVVIAVADGADPAWLHRRVAAFVPDGAYAEQVAADQHLLVALPDGVPATSVAALLVNALAAREALRRGGLQLGKRVLVRGAGGGLGYAATQLAAIGGADVAVTTSSAARGERLRELGAAQVLGRDGRADGVAPAPFDVIIDPVAGPDLARFFDLLRDDGKLITCGFAAWFPEADVAAPMFNNIIGNRRSLTFSVLTLNSVPIAETIAALGEIVDLIASGQLKPVIDVILPLSQAAHAHARLERGDVLGRIVLVPDALFQAA